MISVQDGDRVDASGELAWFRQRFYDCLPARGDALFELTDAVLCEQGPVTSLVGLSLTGEHRRGHGALYDGLNQGRVDIGRFSNLVARQRIPRCDGGRIVLGIDVSNWLRPDAATSPERLFCHTYGRGRGQAQMIPGWPYSFVAALEPGRTSQAALLDARRLGPDDADTDVAAGQLRTVIERLIAGGHWTRGDPEIWIVGDSGYDGPRLAFVLADLPVHVLAQVRSDRVLAFPAPPRLSGTVGRGKRHGAEFEFKDSQTWPEPAHTTSTDTSRYGTAQACSWDRLHPRLTHRGVWAEHDGPPPVIEGTVLRLQVERLPGDGAPKPRIRTPEAADRWTWLIIACHTQLRLARHLVEDLCHPWERRCTRPGRLTPARVRRGFRNIRPTTALPASAPKPSRPGPGRPPRSRNTRRAPLHDPGKTIKTDIAA